MYWLETYGLVGLFGVTFVSSTIIPFPSEAAVLYCSQHFSIYQVLIIATIGNSLGGTTNYFLGQFARKKWMKKTTPKAEKLVNKYGAWAAWLSWVPFIGDPLMIALGVYQTKKIPTFLFMTLGKGIRYYVLLMLWDQL